MSPGKTESRFPRLGSVDPKELVDARLRAHWAVQVPSAVADAVAERLPDDSQSNLGWDAGRGALVTNVLPGDLQAGLRLRDLTLLFLEDASGEARTRELPLDGKTLDEALAFARDQVASRASREIGLREYDMPDHAVRSRGAPFTARDTEEFAELARWFAGADVLLAEVAARESGASTVRCWPHHFDLATLIVLDPYKDPESARSIGVGLSPGDDSYAEPYYYMNPWPRPDREDRPSLDNGAVWHEDGWFGAVLPASRIDTTAGASAQEAQVRGAIASAIRADRVLLGAS